MQRHLLTSVLLGLAASLGCSSSSGGDQERLAGWVSLSRFPTRTDLLVDKMPEAAPARWFTPGFPPLKTLQLGPLSPDKDLLEGLLAEQRKRNILDPVTSVPASDRADYERVMTDRFGTPHAPHLRLPTAEELKKIGGEARDLKLLPEAESAKSALGLNDAVLARGAVVYRRWCMHCHGATGGGDGSNAPQLQPLPRDYRQGIFKFVSTGPEAAGRPLKSDLKRTIRRGLDGSMMVAFTQLSEQELDDVASYVIYLSLRGESEYQSLKMLIKYNDDFLSVENEVVVQLLRALAAWGKAQGQGIQPPPEHVATQAAWRESAQKGQAAYNEAGCAACHANYGRTLVLKYDAWGGISQPRNFLLGVYRGGRRGEDLYLRLYSGIAGSGMPAHKQLLEKYPPPENQPDRIWNIVHFLQALGDPRQRQWLNIE